MVITKKLIKSKALKVLSVVPHVLLLILVVLTISFSAEGHPGDTDEHGCHYDRKDRYHCH